METAKAKQIWADVLEHLRRELSKPAFETWFEPTQAVSYTDHVLTISTVNDFARDWLESRYNNQVNRVLQTVTKAEAQVVFTREANGDDQNTIDARGETIWQRLDKRLDRIEKNIEEIKSIVTRKNG